MMTGYPKPYELDQFFGAYFHQDWDLEADDWQGIVDQFSASATRTSEQLNELADNLDHLTSQYSEDRLATVISSLGGYYNPRPEMTFTNWLQQVAERLRENAKSIDTS
jgi:hypothetical protein